MGRKARRGLQWIPRIESSAKIKIRKYHSGIKGKDESTPGAGS
jgi:hypothetical protein